MFFRNIPLLLIVLIALSCALRKDCHPEWTAKRKVVINCMTSGHSLDIEQISPDHIIQINSHKVLYFGRKNPLIKGTEIPSANLLKVKSVASIDEIPYWYASLQVLCSSDNTVLAHVYVGETVAFRTMHGKVQGDNLRDLPEEWNDLTKHNKAINTDQ